ncbi:MULTISPECIES: mechanosensitive ion channel family protein [unclassified Coleofasciculus]|uniref:mechanosensitive ion channel family protein n=1 Tax=Cyanophyceae TaxID=3028117 RepID=UPI0016883557|nr:MULTISPECIES: mechanosensitive ion channel family protein [unclassified Coleofasciculus]MBD1881122.1 mechanosensitive ion channel family protein [Coleofasciculus sp. FACHB-T130]MBD2085676.1 mechanosensitive ion channel family protein [Coleofasciculus sp. FACHB-542]MBD2541519.1 mechanosensitive ion channel family protein [Coleofasciculus sp. FACHB-SPT36]
MAALIKEIQQSLLNLMGQTIEALPGILMGIAILCLTRYGANLVRRLVRGVGRRALKNPSLRLLLVQTSFVGTWVVGILFACVVAFPDLRLGDIIGLLGLSSVAIGFAFQDIFKNFLAGVLLLLQEPFRLGDQVIVNGFEGTIEEISLRATQIITYQGERIVVPNAIVFTSPVQVLTAMPHRRTDLEIGVDYNTPLPYAVETLLEAVLKVEGVLSKPAPEVDGLGFGDSSMNLVVRYWTSPHKVDVRRTRTKVMIALKQACDRADINIPYPIRTLYNYNQQQFNDASPVADGAQKS